MRLEFLEQRTGGIGGRLVPPSYTAPDEVADAPPGDALGHDCWALGVILFELAVGAHSFDWDAVRERDSRNPLLSLLDGTTAADTLNRVVADCLAPTAALRPTVDTVARWLSLAARVGGNWAGELELLIDDPDHSVLCHPTNGVLHEGTLYTANLGRWHITKVPLP